MSVSPLCAKTLYVNGATGNDGVSYAANGPSAPWRTIGRAAWGSTNRSSPNTNEAARAGDIVTVLPGTYSTVGTGERFNVAYLPANSGTASNPIVFQGSGTVILTYTSGIGPMIGTSGLYSGARDYITWRGFTIDEANAPSASDTGMAVGSYASGVTFEDNILIGIPNNPRADNYNAIRLEAVDGGVVRNNRISNIYGAFGRNHSAITTYYSGNILIEHNEIVGARNLPGNNGGSAIYLKADFPNRGPITVRFNLVSDHEFAGIDILREPATSGNPVRVYQNIFRNCSDAIFINAFDGGATDPRNSKIVNNTIVDSSQNSCFINNSMVPDANRVFWNNIIVGGSVGINHASTNPLLDKNRLDSEHNVIFNVGSFAEVGAAARTLASWQSLYGQDAASPQTITSNPQFVNHSAGDFHLQGASPARTVGVDTFDLDADGSTTDIISAGAYVTGSEIIGRTSNTVYTPGGSVCDLNSDTTASVIDVQLCSNQAIGLAACSTGDVNQDSQCNVVDVQRVVNAALGGQCITQ